MKKLSEKEIKSEYNIQNLESNLDAIESMYEMEGNDIINNFRVFEGNNNVQKLRLANVDISVRPEIILWGRNRQGKETIGGIKLFISKNHDLMEKESILYNRNAI